MNVKCSVPGCRSKSQNPRNKAVFYSVQGDSEGGSGGPLAERRKREWINVIFGATDRESLCDIVVCSKHFVSGQPSRDLDVDDVDWLPSVKLPRMYHANNRDPIVTNIINNLPEVITKFDAPEYIVFDALTFSETAIEKHFAEKYLTNPICDENGYYNNDHDYLGLPIAAPVKTEICRHAPNRDHNYSVPDRPACHYFDSRHFCNICSFVCENLFRFNQHITAHTLRNHVTCKFCPRTFLTSTCLNNHLITHTTLCEKCGNEVPTVQLKAHHIVNFKQKFKHPDSKRYKVLEKNKVHFCVKCMMWSEDLKKFRNHLCFKKMAMLKRLKML